MSDQEFLNHAEHLLTQLELACDHLNDSTALDIDNQRVGSMITLTLANQSQIVVNLQKPLHEVWLASRSGGYHFKHQNDAWMDTKGQGEFWQQLQADLSAQTANSVDLTAFALSVKARD
jgi:CyaY protein